MEVFRGKMIKSHMKKIVILSLVFFSFLQYTSQITPEPSHMEIITPQRIEDNKDDLWTTFNVIQEKFIRGGVDYKSNSGRKTSLKGLKNIIASNQMNTKLWTLAETLV